MKNYILFFALLLCATSATTVDDNQYEGVQIKAGCWATCQRKYPKNCREVKANYNYQGGYASGSGSN